MKDEAAITSAKPTEIQPQVLTLADPTTIVDNATKAAKALKKVIDQRPEKIIINNKQYLTFDDWQTLGMFYGITSKIEWTRPIKQGKTTIGWEARAVAIQRGSEISAAEAECLYGESEQWSSKSDFQFRSMSQTRAAAKCLRNVLAGVVVLAGYSPTPAEEMEVTGESRQATPKQISYIKKNFAWKKINAFEFESQFKPIDQLTLDEAKKLLDFLFDKENKNATLEQILDLFIEIPELQEEPEPPVQEGELSEEDITEVAQEIK